VSEDLRQELQLLREMQLDAINQSKRMDRKFQKLRLAMVHAIHTQRGIVQTAVDDIDAMIEGFLTELEDTDNDIEAG
jgi:hypothetical protein